jgi:hypothetical protein
MPSRALKSWVIIALATLMGGHSQATDWSSRWQQEWAGTQDHSSQKLESLLDVEWNGNPTGQLAITAIVRLRLDGAGQLNDDQQRPVNVSDLSAPLVRGQHGELSLRELYADADWFNSYWRIGKQQVVWGQADGLKVLDVVTPQSYREFILDDFDDSRIPLWMVNAEIPVGEEGTLQLLWIPDTTYHELAAPGTDFAITTPLRVPQPPTSAAVTITGVNQLEADKPNHWLKDSDLGVRYSVFASGWDLSFNYLYHYRDFAVNYQSLRNGQLTIAPEYERSHLLGATASNAFGDWTLRTEVGWYSHSYHLADNITGDGEQLGIAESPEISSVIGLDFQGWSDTYISVQWFQSLLLDYDHSITRDRHDQTLTLLAERHFANETWTLSLRGQYSLNQRDQLWRPRLNHLFSSNLELWLGADFFEGDSKGLYGQFDRRDRMTVGFEWGF